VGSFTLRGHRPSVVSAIGGLTFVDTLNVSFQYRLVKNSTLKYAKRIGEVKVQRTYHLSRLKEHRNRRGLTQMELSKLSDVGRATIARLENDPDHGAYRGTVTKLAKSLKVKPHELEG
jgi:DNA-binding XRE family transcriptional regulator